MIKVIKNTRKKCNLAFHQEKKSKNVQNNSLDIFIEYQEFP